MHTTKPNQRGVTLIETVVAMVLLTILSLTAFGGLLATTKVYGEKLEDFHDLENVYEQIEGASSQVPLRVDGQVSFNYGGSSNKVTVKGQYRYGLDSDKENVVIVEFVPGGGGSADE
ncbi:MAG: PulJ/GspJ family protein [Cellulosilyticaceae bacterium]